MITAAVQREFNYVDDDGTPRQASSTYQLATDANYSPDVVDDLAMQLDRLIRRVEDDLDPDHPDAYLSTIEETDQ